MRCACPACSILMPQAASELECVCQGCGYTCAACMGAGDGPLSPEAISALGESLLGQEESREC